MNKKPPELPNIEDATLRACLAPLMEIMNSAVETSAPAILASVPVEYPAKNPMVSNDNPAPPVDAVASRDHEYSGTPKTLVEWRSLADDEFGAFRMLELFLGMTDAELERAAAEFPRQIAGTIARISRIKKRLAAQYDTATTAIALLERAMARGSGGGKD